VTGGLEWVRALCRTPESGIIPCVVPNPGRAQYDLVTRIQILATACTVVAPRWGAVGSLVLTVRERLDSRYGAEKSGVRRSHSEKREWYHFDQEELQ